MMSPCYVAPSPAYMPSPSYMMSPSYATTTVEISSDTTEHTDDMLSDVAASCGDDQPEVDIIVDVAVPSANDVPTESLPRNAAEPVETGEMEAENINGNTEITRSAGDVEAEQVYLPESEIQPSDPGLSEESVAITEQVVDAEPEAQPSGDVQEQDGSLDSEGFRKWTK